VVHPGENEPVSKPLLTKHGKGDVVGATVVVVVVVVVITVVVVPVFVVVVSVFVVVGAKVVVVGNCSKHTSSISSAPGALLYQLTE
jgi:hypothetical protein